MREQLEESSAIFHQACSDSNGLKAQGAARGFCILAEMIEVSRTGGVVESMLKHQLVDRPQPNIDDVGHVLRGIEARASIKVKGMLSGFPFVSADPHTPAGSSLQQTHENEGDKDSEATSNRLLPDWGIE